MRQCCPGVVAEHPKADGRRLNIQGYGGHRGGGPTDRAMAGSQVMSGSRADGAADWKFDATGLAICVGQGKSCRKAAGTMRVEIRYIVGFGVEGVGANSATYRQRCSASRMRRSL